MKKTELTIKVFELDGARIIEAYREGERIEFKNITEYEISVLIDVISRKRGELSSEQ